MNAIKGNLNYKIINLSVCNKKCVLKKKTSPYIVLMAIFQVNMTMTMTMTMSDNDNEFISQVAPLTFLLHCSSSVQNQPFQDK